MLSNSPDIAQSVTIVAGTYLLHSTILLAGVWLFTRVGRVRSHVLAERLWKTAAVLGMITALVQLTLGWSGPAFVATLGRSECGSYASGGARTSASHDSFYSASGAGTGSVDQEGSNATAPASRAVHVLGLADGDDGDGSEYRGEVPKGTASGRERVHSPDERSDHRFAVSPDATEGRSSRALWTDEPRGRGSPGSQTDTTSGWWGYAISPPPGAVSATAAAILIVGVIVCGLFLLLVRTALFRRRCAGSREMDDGPARRILDRLLQKNSIRRQVRLLSSNAFDEPVAFGLVRWTIVLPGGMEERLGRDEVKALLAHELAHFVRGDVVWLWIGRALCSCLAFQPLNFAARRSWQHAAEFLCDDWAIGRGGSAISLARCLTRIAEWRLEEGECAAALAVGGSSAKIVERVERLVNSTGRVDVWTRPLRQILLRVAAGLTAASLVCIAPRVAFPARAAGTHGRDAQRDYLESAYDRNGASALGVEYAVDWQLLEEDLLHLERDLSYVFQLLTRTSHEPEIYKSAEQMHRHVLAIQQRRHALAGQINKESDR